MNISQPISSQLQGVSFGCLSAKDIRSLSAKRITNATTFDTLLNPVPGGLYTSELGQFGDNACGTCGLKNPQCPGHPGHIELPVPCYHPTFMDQILRLLRSACIYCGKLKMKRVLVARYICKLRLVKYGLLKELNELDELEHKVSKGQQTGASDSEEDEEGDAEVRAITQQFEKYTRDAIKRARKSGLASVKTEVIKNARTAIVRQFMADITKGKKCGNCEAINHTYRKDRFVKIFRKPLSEKDHAAMVQRGLRPKDPVIQLQKAKRANRKRKRDEDEAVADLDRSSEEEGDDLEDSSEGEPEIVGGDVLSEAAEAQPSGTKPTKTEDYINPTQVRAHIQQLFERDTEVMNLVYGIDTQKSPIRLSADMFFIEAVLVPPNRYRPEAKTGNNEIAEAMENGLYKDLITTSENIAAIQKEVTSEEPREVSRYRARTYADLESAWLQLQDNVNVVIDRNLSPLQGRAGARNADGVKQKLEKKEGMFRKYMMGKRVNFAARTVISPDPNIETNEIGVPPVFAVKLTYPEPVNQHNYEDMQQAVKNGPYVWPGAVAIESETGAVLNLANKTADERLALANSLLAPSSGSNTHGARPKKVHRHLNNGDIVIMNRQPTLHKPSMMCHKARVLPGEKTLRMHYANCNTYNADFDGDEMNMHFPQNELARAEALLVADTDHQYLSGTAGNPLRGLIQDHISMCVWLTNRDLFFERGEYMNLLYAAIRPEDRHCEGQRLEIMPPAIMKPKPLWTGKQVISTVLKNLQPAGTGGLNMTGKSTLDASMWGDAGKEEAIVIFKDGELMTGILDKKQIGPSAGGFVNAVYEAYGYRAAGRLLSILGRLLTKLLHMRAFSCGVEDVILARNGEKNRRDVLTKAAGIGLEVAAKYVSMADQKPKSEDRELRRRLEDVMRDETKQQGLDQLTNSATSGLSGEVSTACMPGGLAKPFPKNQMQTMTTTGAKGSRVNANLISCNLGQQVLEGRRVPVMVSGKTLPCFKPFESNVRAGGYIVDRFLTGIRPQEYFFHAMAGREGLIDTAVKTSRSGYLQRCLIKGMEGLRAEHDSSVRHTEDGSIVQFLYGEDGLDIGKAKYLSDLKFTAENYLSLFHTYQMENSKQLLRDEVKDHAKAAEKKYRKTGDLAASDPALSLYPPGVYGGSISEKALSSSREFVDANKEKLIKDKKNPDGIVGKKNFNNILDLRYLKSVVEPGEAVGVVAGQSVGEPSTQMTLNTFHLAGHAAKNVTLGIPRLREIVMTAAANISTPAMTLVMNSGLSVDDAKKFAKGISKLSLAEIVDRVTVTESVGKGVGYAEARKYDIKLDFFPSEEYEKEYAITIQDVVATLEHRFLPRLQAAARKELKKRNAQKTLKTAANDDALPEVGQSAGRIEEERARPEGQREGGDDDSDDEGDDDATRDKSKSNKQQAGYEAYEDDDEQRLRQRQATPEPSDSEEEDETYGGSPRTSPEPGAQDDHQSARSAAKDREARIRGNDGKTNDIVTFNFDDKKGATCSFTMEYSSEAAKILILNIVELSLHQALIQSVPGMSLCMLDEDATKKGDGRPVLAASGTNITAMWDYQHIINPHQIYTNSIHDVLIHYGVEAARNAIVKEISGVFGGHGISVDVRHLTLIADYMTRDGAYQAFSRMGYRNNPSPFMKMSFETTLNFLRDAVLEGDFDDLEGPSARIVAGRVGKMGTGGFDVLMPLHDSKESQEGDEDVEMED